MSEIRHSAEQSMPTTNKLSWNVISKIIKTGIIKSNTFTAFVGLFLALHIYEESFLDNLFIILLTLVGTALVIGGACAINNWYDTDIDTKMERTQQRPTVNGVVSRNYTLRLGISLVAWGSLALFAVSYAAGIMGLLGVAFYVFAYTMLTKRTTVWNTEVGSISGAIPPLIGWGAISGDFTHPIAIGLFVIMFFWQPPHFFALAIRRVDEYKEAGVPMLPVVKGVKRAKLQTILYLIPLLASSFLFYSLGSLFVIITAALTIVWMILGIRGFKTMNDHKWATMMFVYSLNYLMIVFALMLLATFI